MAPSTNQLIVPSLPLDVWDSIWSCWPRRERLRLSITCSAWRSSIYFNPATWRYILLTDGSHGEEYVNAGALRLNRDQMAFIPDLAFVEILVVATPGDWCNSTIYSPAMRAYHEASWPIFQVLCDLHFPCLRALYVELDSFEYAQIDSARRDTVFAWLGTLPECSST